MFDMFQLPFMVQAFVAAAITGVLLSYLGVHVVGRGIVFVDLALGQISSLGVAFAAFIGTGLTSIPLIFTLSGALLMRHLIGEVPGPGIVPASQILYFPSDGTLKL